jgi:hypothetical protein
MRSLFEDFDTVDLVLLLFGALICIGAVRLVAPFL